MVKLTGIFFLLTLGFFTEGKSLSDSISENKSIHSRVYSFFKKRDTINCKIYYSVNPQSYVLVQYIKVDRNVWVLKNKSGAILELGKFRKAGILSRILRNDHSMYKTKTWLFLDGKGFLKEVYDYKRGGLFNDPGNFHSLDQYNIIEYYNYPPKPIVR